MVFFPAVRPPTLPRPSLPLKPMYFYLYTISGSLLKNLGFYSARQSTITLPASFLQPKVPAKYQGVVVFNPRHCPLELRRSFLPQPSLQLCQIFIEQYKPFLYRPHTYIYYMFIYIIRGPCKAYLLPAGMNDNNHNKYGCFLWLSV